MDEIEERLNALVEARALGGWVAPHKNFGRMGGKLPWVLMPANYGPATTYYNERDLLEAIEVLEQFGAMLLSGRR